MGLKKIQNRDGDKIWVFDSKDIKSKDADYNILVSERSDGKSFSVLEDILNDYLQHGNQGVIIRRFDEDFKKGRGKKMWANLVYEEKLKGSGWEDIIYRNGAWYLAKYIEDDDKWEYDYTPLCYALSISNMEHDKSNSFPKVKTILFDEFITRGTYFPDEFVLFANVLSTIIRHRDNVKIWMCANTVSFECPYFDEMGITNIRKLEQGTIQVYEYGESKLKVAIEYIASKPKKETPSDKYFAFDNPKLKMITGGAWEIGIYPHLPVRYKPMNIKFRYYIKWRDEILECEIIHLPNQDFTFIHKKTTPFKDENKDLIFCPEADPRNNWRRNILNPYDDIGKTILGYYTRDKVFYQNNLIGELVRNYLNNCRQFDIIRA